MCLSHTTLRKHVTQRSVVQICIIDLGKKKKKKFSKHFIKVIKNETLNRVLVNVKYRGTYLYEYTKRFLFNFPRYNPKRL